MTIRLWQQAASDIDVLPKYKALLDGHARAICREDTLVRLNGIESGIYQYGLLPVDTGRFPWWRHIVSTCFVQNAMRAERDGFDAVVSTCFLDPGLQEARSVVDIPVVSALESALLVGMTVARRIGLITINDAFARTLEDLITAYGFSQRVVKIATLDPPLTEPEIEPIFAGSQAFVERFSRQVNRMNKAGIDVIIPAEGVLNSALVSNSVTRVGEIPVLDSFGVVLLHAEMMVELRRRTGLSIGRSGYYLRPSDKILDHIGNYPSRHCL